MEIEYLGLFVHQLKEDQIVRLCDCTSFLKSTFPISEIQIRSTLKLLYAKMKEDKVEKKQLNYNYAYYVFYS